MDISRVSKLGAAGVGRTAILLCVALAAASAPLQARGASATPIFLVATRNVLDPLFQQSVVLILPITQPPLVAGVIINKRTRIQVRDLFRKTPVLRDRGENAYFGGPVEVDALSLVTRLSRPSAKATRLFEDVYMSTDEGSITNILQHSGAAKDLRMFLGRAQWSDDQLHAEMLENSWYIVPAKAEMVFSPNPESLWRTLIQRAELQEVDATPTLVPADFRLMRGDLRVPAEVDGLSW